jgi:transcriptional regulator with XRE-family HTH domain
MITGAQMRAARALLGVDQRQLAALAGLSVPTIQRMEGSEGSVRAVVDSLEKVLEALSAAGVEFIAAGGPSVGCGPGVRLLQPSSRRRAADVA